MEEILQLERDIQRLPRFVQVFVAPLFVAVKALVEKLLARVAELEHELYGKKSEKRPPQPRTEDPTRAAERAARRRMTSEERKARRADATARAEAERAKLARERVRVVIAPERTCRACGGVVGEDSEPIGYTDPTEQVELQPHKAVVREFRREVRRCRCGCILTAKPPPQVQEGGEYGPALHAHIAVARALDNIPLHRQAAIFARGGQPIAESQVNVMFHRVAEAIEPIYKRLLDEVRAAPAVHCDETRQPVLQAGGCRKGWMWTFTHDRAEVYVYDPSRGSKVPKKTLGDSPGAIIADDYRGYDPVIRGGKRKRGGCWCHARRTLLKARGAAPEPFRRMLEDVDVLFAVEADAKQAGIAGTPAHLDMRRRRAGPAIDRVMAELEALRPQHPPDSRIGKTCAYILGQRAELRLFLDDIRVAPHNNRGERALRPIAQGRKNSLFVGNDEGGEHLAMVLSAVRTCRLHGVEPEDWLADVLVRVNDVELATTVDELLPWNWIPKPRSDLVVDSS